ncbi:MAG: M14 family zinc carboxypeptidase, partial [Planctomycetota bacterium]
MLTRCAFVLSALLSGTVHAQSALPAAPPTPLPGLMYDAPFFPGAKYDAAVPTPDSILGYRLGDKAARHAEVEAVIKAIADKAPARVKLFEYATSHEGRKLYYLAISSPANVARLDAIKADAARLADPRTLTKAQHDELAAGIPAIAWLGYVIHGNEMSGTDAALAAIYHLAAGTDASVTTLLDETVVLIDPLMNPDGRDRCITQINQHRTAQPAVDDQSVIHAETWPGGRTNHYLFDMNRDWIWGTQPESRGRIKAAGDWNPHYFVESHEQSTQDTFLFMPPRAPVNPNIPQNIAKWSAIFGDDQGKAFDRFGWRYYTGEWNEEWFPGYSGSWAALRGAIDNLYEQARIITDGARRHEGTIEPYREAVHKQLVSTMANLATLQRHRREIVKDFAVDRWRMVSDESPYATRSFVLAGAEGNKGRWDRLMDIFKIQGIEAYQLTAELKASGRDGLGREVKDRVFPAGTLVVPGRQPQGRIAAAILELDPRMSPAFLTEERRELLRFGQSRLYDTTAWNAAMLYGVDAFEIDAALPNESRLAATQTEPAPPAPADIVAWAFDGRDDRSVALAARLMDQSVRVRVLNKPTVLNAALARGTVFVSKKDNQAFAGDLAKVVADSAKQFGLAPAHVTTGMGPGDLPDVGGQHFVLLEQPRIAVLTGDPFNSYT